MFKNKIFVYCLFILPLCGIYINAVAQGSRKPTYILTPKPGAAPQINGPQVFGVRPGHPLIYRIPVTGIRPMSFGAKHLPKGIKINKKTGQLSGIIRKPGKYPVTLEAKNKKGKAARPFTIVVGEKISLTPAMGWSSWNIYGSKVTQAKVLANAKAMVSSGLINHGWTYVNIDDAWQGKRGGEWNAIQPDPKFPDMQNLSNEIHQMGLKFGLYSTPWVESFAHHIGGTSENPLGVFTPAKNKVLPGRNLRNVFPYVIGKYSFVDQDVKQWVSWGVDYLKYDWNPIELPAAKKMFLALRNSGRDILLSLSNNALYTRVDSLSHYANSWRTGHRDNQDNWETVKFRIFSQDGWASYAGPGHWNDPDILLVGYLGWGSGEYPTHLTPDEQYTHISAWCLMSAPLLIGCDLTKLDLFTLSLLTNDEVLALDQDPLGQQATIISRQGEHIVMAKDLANGTKAAGLFNLGDDGTQQITLSWKDLHISGSYIVRDLWRQKDLGTFNGEFKTRVPQHGVVLVSLRKSK